MAITPASAPAMIETRTMASIISRAVMPPGTVLEVLGGFKGDFDIESSPERP
jgi:hypothetical protein